MRSNKIFYSLQLSTLNIITIKTSSNSSCYTSNYSNRRLHEAIHNETKLHTRTHTRSNTWASITHICNSCATDSVKQVQYMYPIRIQQDAEHHVCDLDDGQKKLPYLHNVNIKIATKEKYYLDTRKLIIPLRPMRLRFIKPNELEKSIRLTIHKSGKLGFTLEASKKLELKPGQSASLAVNEEEPDSRDLYMVINQKEEEGAFKISRAAPYYFINTKLLFDNLNVDYASGKIAYDMKKIVVDGETMYELKQHIRKTDEED